MSEEDIVALVSVCVEEGYPFGRIVREVRDAMGWPPCPEAIAATRAALATLAG